MLRQNFSNRKSKDSTVQGSETQKMSSEKCSPCFCQNSTQSVNLPCDAITSPSLVVDTSSQISQNRSCVLHNRLSVTRPLLPASHHLPNSRVSHHEDIYCERTLLNIDTSNDSITSISCYRNRSTLAIHQIVRLILLFHSIAGIFAIHPQDREISWQPYNELFSQKDPVLYVHEKDFLIFECPLYAQDYHIYWTRSKPAYDRCQPDIDTVNLFNCATQPGSKFTMQVVSFSPIINNPSFNTEEPVYFIAQHRICKKQNMRLMIIKVNPNNPNPVIHEDFIRKWKANAKAKSREDNSYLARKKGPNYASEIFRQYKTTPPPKYPWKVSKTSVDDTQKGGYPSKQITLQDPSSGKSSQAQLRASLPTLLFFLISFVLSLSDRLLE